ncbi:MAG: hypothetical protein AAF738_11305 [Bacteroidota bacterium]
MPNLIKDYETIQRFFEFQLTEEERQHFEARMETDDAFFQKIRTYQRTADSMDHLFSGHSKTDKEKREAHWKTMLTDSSPRIRSLRTRTKWWIAAASITILLATGIGLWNTSTALSSEQLALTYWEKADFSYAKRSIEQNAIDPILLNAIDSYADGEYVVSLNLVEGLNGQMSNVEQVILLRGHCRFNLKNYENAIVAFQQIIDTDTSTRKDEAHWYKALALIALERQDEAIGELGYIIAQGYPKADDARRLLHSLE